MDQLCHILEWVQCWGMYLILQSFFFFVKKKLLFSITLCKVKRCSYVGNEYRSKCWNNYWTCVALVYYFSHHDNHKLVVCTILINGSHTSLLLFTL